MHTVIGQVYDMFTASEVKLALMELYPDDYEVIVGHALGIKDMECIQRMPIYELDRLHQYSNVTLIWVLRTEREEVCNRMFHLLHEIISILRSPAGCPWDRKQTHKSIRKNFIEETYEALETIDNDDPVAIEEELGDVLLQNYVSCTNGGRSRHVYHLIYDVIQSLNSKLIFRHPHVFDDQFAEDATSALHTWERMKQLEKGVTGAHSCVPLHLPEVLKAYTL